MPAPTCTGPLQDFTHVQQIVSVLGGSIDACLLGEDMQPLRHGQVIVCENQISATFELPPETIFCVSWRSHNAITALAALVHPSFDGTHVQDYCCTAVLPMDAHSPETQHQNSSDAQMSGAAIDGWFTGPQALQIGFVQLEFRKAVRTVAADGFYDYDYDTSPEAAQCLPLIFRFNLIGTDPPPSLGAGLVNPTDSTSFARSRSPSPDAAPCIPYSPVDPQNPPRSAPPSYDQVIAQSRIIAEILTAMLRNGCRIDPAFLAAFLK
ncbi:unnamed protein product [Mycena citricolor]|uniref:Uncharacterized protein n=1 Tax=Mycena citricolor TaxID=2018698 RepID=A0AAD2HN58_9AGAR|nr:unnamed protein product [Mycena citricolor]